MTKTLRGMNRNDKSSAAKIANAIRAGSWVATTMATVAVAKTSG